MEEFICDNCGAVGNDITVKATERINGFIGNRCVCNKCGDTWGEWIPDDGKDGTKGLFDDEAKE